MQSPEQITCYINLGNLQPNGNGGIKVWLGSHKEGITANRIIKKNKKRVTKNKNYIETNYQASNFHFNKGDFAVFNSLLHHEGIQNHSNCTRIVQLIRYSNLLNKHSKSYNWQSTNEMKIIKSIKFEEVHSKIK